MPLPAPRVVIIGAGIGGLAAAVDLARQGIAVTVVDRQPHPGGKMRETAIGGARIDAGPTVFTMRGVFDELFAAAGTTLAEHLTLRPVERLARHAWTDGARLDLYADLERSVAAIGEFAGLSEAQRFRAFSEAARRTYATLEAPYIRSGIRGPLGLARSAGLSGLAELWRIRPFASLWRVLGEFFRDPRLRQLFGRYATYCGSSPFRAPATLMLVAHVEREGVWLVDGGMQRVAIALASLAVRHGATFRQGVEATAVELGNGRVAGVLLENGERIAAHAVIANADVAAIASGRLGRTVAGAASRVPEAQRSLSAVTLAMTARTDGFPLLRHNVFFSDHYEEEFDDIFRRRRLPQAPTVYVCAQDRDDFGGTAACGAERLFCIVNAPATGDRHPFHPSERTQCEERTFDHLARCGLQVTRPQEVRVTTPAEFEQLYPGTGGALYGRASHGWTASFRRPGARTRIPGLYLAGGSTHPGPGIPMAATSGRLAAAALMADRVSIGRSRTVAMRGGMSMP
jgi:1-hydroxycarotenoid 3,4-desaturase